MSNVPALEVHDLTISVRVRSGWRANVVEDVSFAVPQGGTLGIVGESGSGKTMTSLAIMGMLPPSARVESGAILLDGEDLLQKTEAQMRQLRGKRIGMVLQDPMTALDPSFTVRSQLAEPLRQHRGLRGAALDRELVHALERVQLSGARERLNQYPHQLSGGMRQRVTSAIALAGEPRLLIADEPTTALDVTTQARYLTMLNELREATGFALILIAHDLLIVQHVCTHVMVMYAGQVVESGEVRDVFAAPMHPYARALLDAVPKFGGLGRLEVIEGNAPDIGADIAGCRFAERCRHAQRVCELTPPALLPRDGRARAARCWGTQSDGWI